MKLEQIIQENSLERIEDAVAKMTQERCIDIFIEYVKTDIEKVTEVEKEFLKEVESRVDQMMIDMYIKTNLKEDNAEKLITEFLRDGFWGYSERDIYEMMDILAQYDEKFAYPYIKNCLEDSYRALLKTREDKEKDKLIKEKERILSNLGYYERSLETARQKLKEIEEKIK